MKPKDIAKGSYRHVGATIIEKREQANTRLAPRLATEKLRIQSKLFFKFLKSFFARVEQRSLKKRRLSLDFGAPNRAAVLETLVITEGSCEVQHDLNFGRKG